MPLSGGPEHPGKRDDGKVSDPVGDAKVESPRSVPANWVKAKQVAAVPNPPFTHLNPAGKIVVRSTDAGGAVGFATATVVVPRNPSPSGTSSVSAQAAAAKAFADGNNGNPPPGYVVIGDGPVIGPLQ
jgi:hypothetical protein